ncbi:hypothetical protein MTR67_038951 [Solanum verrucosum]|uniref:Tf2-1-like SH3-like domain-containing protein n=1 Tax=Solanum verrucosum TaxID=315347 RepID=A0AAF0UHD6_SOLVR|nr:hypothetical protein MTR67_038951 [Solanum verrucosum]
MRFGKKGKLSPRYISPYRISKRIGNVAYELELPDSRPDSRSPGSQVKNQGGSISQGSVEESVYLGSYLGG